MYRWTLVLAGLMFAAVASAQDGALEINQACVEDGCFEGDVTGGFPVTTNDGSGLYRLTSNLEVSDGSQAISAFGAEGKIVIDLNGFSIIGPNDCDGQPVTDCSGPNSSAGIYGQGEATIVVRNGSISGFDEGVVCEDACVLEDLELSNNSSFGAIQAVGGNDEGMIVRNCTFKSNGGTVLAAAGRGTMVVDSVFKWNEDGPSVLGGSFLDNVVIDNGAGSFFGVDTLISRSMFSESDPFSSGGVSNGDNVCDGSPC